MRVSLVTVAQKFWQLSVAVNIINGRVYALITRVFSKAQLVFGCLVSHGKHLISSMGSFAFGVLQIYTKRVVQFGQAVDLVQSQPILTTQVAKTSFVVTPASVKVN